MKTGKAAFILTGQRPVANLPLDGIMDHYARVRDAIAGTPHIETDTISVVLANASFVYAFNTFKALSLLLPGLYFESAAAVMRQLWEVSLNLHWIALDIDARATAFCGYTIMEYRKTLQRSDDPKTVAAFDAATSNFRAQYSFTDRNGKDKHYSNYANLPIQQRADKLGDPWSSEYACLYSLTSMHAHGAPGAILQSIFRQHYTDPIIRERDSSALTAVMAIKTMVRNVDLLARLAIIIDQTNVRREYAAFLTTLDKHAGK